MTGGYERNADFGVSKITFRGQRYMIQFYHAESADNSVE